VPAVARSWYLPLTPPVNCERSYSGRRSSLLLGTALLVGMSFTARGDARTDDADPIYAAIRMRDKKKPLLARYPDRNESTFGRRMIGIIERLSERIQEYCCGLIE